MRHWHLSEKVLYNCSFSGLSRPFAGHGFILPLGCLNATWNTPDHA